jgi:uncharacterized coiled-coil protein SlyX
MDFEKVLQIMSIAFGVGGIGSFFLSMRRTKSQNQLDISTAWEKLSAPLLARVKSLEDTTEKQEKTIQELNSFIDDLLDWNKLLVEQVIEAGKIPHPFVRRKRITTEYPKTQE